MSNKGVCRTAPAQPGLLMMSRNTLSEPQPDSASYIIPDSRGLGNWSTYEHTILNMKKRKIIKMLWGNNKYCLMGALNWFDNTKVGRQDAGELAVVPCVLMPTFCILSILRVS